jgi:hypothetical protein
VGRAEAFVAARQKSHDISLGTEPLSPSEQPSTTVVVGNWTPVTLEMRRSQ